jgi:hypothetical protein
MQCVHSRPIFRFDPVGLDAWEGRGVLERGMLVVKVQPAGTPRNGTMGHTFVGDLNGDILGLVLTRSLHPTGLRLASSGRIEGSGSES